MALRLKDGKGHGAWLSPLRKSAYRSMIPLRFDQGLVDLCVAAVASNLKLETSADRCAAISLCDTMRIPWLGSLVPQKNWAIGKEPFCFGKAQVVCMKLCM